MLNAAQMAKLQKKVAKEVDVKIKAREEEERKRKESIKNMILFLEKENPERGACLCYYYGITYYVELKSKALRAVPIPPDFNDCDLMDARGKGKIDEELYYMIKPEIAKENDEILEWLKENYALVKIYSSKAREDISYALGLGTIYEKFQEKFPKKTMLDLISYIKMMDRIISKI